MYPPLGPDPDSCYDSYVCNWMNCTSLGYPADVCKEECLNTDLSEEFCGLCENGVECVEFPEINSKDRCEQSSACVHEFNAEILDQVITMHCYASPFICN